MSSISTNSDRKKENFSDIFKNYPESYCNYPLLSSVFSFIIYFYLIFSSCIFSAAFCLFCPINVFIWRKLLFVEKRFFQSKQKFIGEFHPPSPLFFNRTKPVLNLAYGGVGPQTPTSFWSTSKGSKNVPLAGEAVPVSKVGSYLSVVENVSLYQTTASTGCKLNFYFQHG